MLAVLRGLPIPSQTEPLTGGTIAKPTVRFDRDPHGDPVIQLLVEHVMSGCVTLDHRPEGTYLRGLWVLPGLRRRGVGSALLSLACEAADDGDAVLALRPEPFDPPGLDTVELSRWYACRFGFRALNCDPSLFVRTPRRWLESPR